MLSEADKLHLAAARRIPIDVLKTVAIEQANNCMLSEAYCLEVAGAWHDAAETARQRRLHAAMLPPIHTLSSGTFADMVD